MPDESRCEICLSRNDIRIDHELKNCPTIRDKQEAANRDRHDSEEMRVEMELQYSSSVLKYRNSIA